MTVDSNTGEVLTPAPLTLNAPARPAGAPGMIHTLLPNAMAEIGAIAKNRENVQQRFNFRGIDDFYAACQPVFAKLGITPAPEVLTHRDAVRVTKNGAAMNSATILMRVTFYAPDGSFIQTVAAGEAQDSGDKATNKAMSAAMKYALTMTFAIPADSPDQDADNTEPAVRQSAARPTAAPTPEPVPFDCTQGLEEIGKAPTLVALKDTFSKWWLAANKAKDATAVSMLDAAKDERKAALTAAAGKPDMVTTADRQTVEV
jgi:hypothetical protein